MRAVHRPMGRPVQEGRFLQLAREGQEELAQQEDAEGAGDAGQDQSGVGLVKPNSRIRMKSGVIVTCWGPSACRGRRGRARGGRGSVCARRRRRPGSRSTVVSAVVATATMRLLAKKRPSGDSLGDRRVILPVRDPGQDCGGVARTASLPLSEALTVQKNGKAS